MESYLYDESNHRVEKTIGSADYFYFYGPGGRLLTILQLWAGTTSLVANRMYFGGLLLGSAGSWVSADVSTMTDRLGTAETGYPYGTDIGSVSASNDQPDFATYTKDATTGFEYANQRYYSAGLGRFLTVDRSNRNVTLLNPYTWNGFGYGNGDPVNSNDPTGLDVYCSGGTPDGEGILQGVSCYDGGASNNGDAISGLPVNGTSVTVTDTQDPVLYYGSTPDDDIEGPLFFSSTVGVQAGGSPRASAPSNALLRFLLTCEGYRGVSYNDTNNNCTVGYGHLMHLGRCSASDFTQHTTPAQAYSQFVSDVDSATNLLNSGLQVELSQAQFDAMVSLSYNMGMRLRRHDVWRDINAGDSASIPGDITSLSGGGAGIPSRRANEANIFIGGVYANNCYVAP